ncbi:hypothetical protein BST61_g8579 [Cercospora zeina]
MLPSRRTFILSLLKNRPYAFAVTYDGVMVQVEDIKDLSKDVQTKRSYGKYVSKIHRASNFVKMLRPQTNNYFLARDDDLHQRALIASLATDNCTKQPTTE